MARKRCDQAKCMPAGRHEKIGAFAVLAASKGDKDALKAKLYAQIMLGRSADALQLIEAHSSIATDVAFEKAYCLFRVGTLDAALEQLQGSDDEGSQHLTAIIQMRKKQSQAASAVYSALAPKVKGNKQGAMELVCRLHVAVKRNVSPKLHALYHLAE